MEEKRLRRLADRIESLTQVDRQRVEQAHEVEATRRHAACGLHATCAAFVADLNRLLTAPQVEFDPPSYSPESFQLDGPNLFQINIRGRILQIEFEAGEKPVSTEEFRVPYVLEGAVRCFNQELLDREAIEEHLLFYCLEKKRNNWRFFDPRTYRTGILDSDYLMSMLEKLVE